MMKWYSIKQIIMQHRPSFNELEPNACYNYMMQDTFITEFETVKNAGVSVTPDNLKISENCSVITSYNKILDGQREDKGPVKIGTTGKGIGPAYEDKIGRRSIRVMDLVSASNLDHRLEAVLIHHNAIRKGLGKQIYKKEQLKKDNLKNQEIY